jgi:flagellar basal-body rod modification protein FlgD
MEINQSFAANTIEKPAIDTPQEASPTSVSSDFEVFLQMLTAQMKYQDPLNPVDSTDYATQLATFSGVEQAVLTNDLLKDLTNQMTIGGLTDLATWVGREARSTAPVQFDGQAIELFPQSIGAADTLEIVVRDGSGVELQRIPYIPSANSLTWTGVLPNGHALQNGQYNFQVVGTSNGEIISEAGVETYSRINEVRIENGQTVAVLRGGASVSSNEVTALREP